MSQRNLFPGQNKHPGNTLWREEVAKTSQIPGWQEKLLERINGVLSSFGGRIRRVGYCIDEVQIQHDVPIASFFSFQSLRLAWVQFNTWDPFSKKPGTRVLRFSEDTAALMLLVRSPKENGEYDWYLLARKKYQFGTGEHFVEFSRGWVPGCQANEMGWYLLDRDFPGLRSLAKGIYHTQLGEAVWENTAEFNNKTSYHLIVVTLAKPTTKEELRDILVRERVKKEYQGVHGYSDLDRFDGDDLVSEPMVFDLEKAAMYLNEHLTGKPEKPFFGEAYSLSCWTRFLALCGKRFGHLAPQKCEIPD